MTGTTTTADKHALKKMWICHRTGSGKYVKMRINRKAWPAHKRHGDTSLEAAAPGTSTTGTTATTGTTSTGKAKGAGRGAEKAPSCWENAGSGKTPGHALPSDHRDGDPVRHPLRTEGVFRYPYRFRAVPLVRPHIHKLFLQGRLFAP